MAGERVQRRLAAILAADVAGYSRLMGSDDEGTLAGLKACRELIDLNSREHRGRIVNTDGRRPPPFGGKTNFSQPMRLPCLEGEL